ncbi:TetR/AcrR family transcriptional regulator [Pengzhenrongella frigida]|uniref:TetR/AcrR family transcriptional regulator n=2 Tax=Pengzhenrongella frigida TaxID=1259133 RepID=A0A4Q5N3Q5_9MICO|nr:TetR/AcrR family transcriptional regulator [Cellulomonas sp. HLT2-17]
MPPMPRTARERVRTELTDEIKAIALAQLAAGGGSALSLRGIAREMNMASSALFRYFRSRDALLTALIIDSYSALAEAAETAEARVHGGSVEDRWIAICHGVRDWAVAQPHEYTLIFGSPIPGYAAPQDTIGPASRVPLLLGSLLGDLVAGGAYDPATHPEPPAAVVRALEPMRTAVAPGIPVDLLVSGLMAWTYLFGALSFELFGHRHDVVGDYPAFFDHEVRRLASVLGLAGPTGRA